MKKWVNVELNREEADVFRAELLSRHIKYEASGCGKLIHFEVLADEEEIKALNEILERM